MTKHEKVKLETKNRVYITEQYDWYINKCENYCNNMSEKNHLFLGAKIAPLPNYPTLASVLNGTARSTKKNSLFITFIKNVSQLGMNTISFLPAYSVSENNAPSSLVQTNFITLKIVHPLPPVLSAQKKISLSSLSMYMQHKLTTLKYVK